MANIEHSAIAAGNIHTPFEWEFATATERTAYTTTDTAELHKLALQVSDFTVWILTSVSPMTWVQIGA